MIILNLFIGIIMNSMAEMHAEIEERDRARQERETGAATLEDELESLEAELKATQARLAGLRRRFNRAGPPAIGRENLEELVA
jgi:chromosome segregation ATPase